MAAQDAVQFLISDHGDTGPLKGFRKTIAEGKPLRSLLQRNNKTFSEVLDLFDWKPDCNKWVEEYKKSGESGNPDHQKLIRYRKCVEFCIGGWRELQEDFNRSDESCLHDILTPLVTSRSPLKAAKDEFTGKGQK